MKYQKIKEIIKQCENDIENDVKELKFLQEIDFIDFFPKSDEHRKLLDKEATKIATLIDATPRGNFYVFNEPFKTKFGPIKIFKVRIFDETRLNWVAAPDFKVANYQEFYDYYKNDKRFKFVEKPNIYKGLEFKTEKSLVYILDEPTTEFYNIK